MSKMRLRHIGVLSVGIVVGALYGILGLVFGIPFSLIALCGAATAKHAAAGSLLCGAFAFAAFPLIYGGMGFVFGILSAALYNFIASFTGGIEVRID